MLRKDYKIISKIINPNSKVLDLGCSDGKLLKLLKKNSIVGTGIDFDYNKINKCIQNGISAIEDNIDTCLEHYPNKSFDYVILNNTLETVKHPIKVLKEATRISKNVIIGFPNFAYYPIRLFLLTHGQMPKSKSLPFEWYNTPNIHLFTIIDFEKLCRKNKFKITKKIYHNKKNSSLIGLNPNFFSENAIFIIK